MSLSFSKNQRIRRLKVEGMTIISIIFSPGRPYSLTVSSYKTLQSLIVILCWTCFRNSMSFVLGSPELDRLLQMWPQQGSTEG